MTGWEPKGNEAGFPEWKPEPAPKEEPSPPVPQYWPFPAIPSTPKVDIEVANGDESMWTPRPTPKWWFFDGELSAKDYAILRTFLPKVDFEVSPFMLALRRKGEVLVRVQHGACEIQYFVRDE